MGLFGKKERKEKKRCDLCGNEMGFFSAHSLADGQICDDCEKLLRGEFLRETYRTRSGTVKQDDPLEDLTLDEARGILARKQAAAAAAVAELGGSYASIFQAEEAFTIAPKATEVGLKRAKLLKDRAVVRGIVLAGAFEQGDAVQLKQGERLTPTTILELIPVTTTSEFDTELGANMHKKTVGAGSGAWLILDVPGADVFVGAMVVK